MLCCSFRKRHQCSVFHKVYLFAETVGEFVHDMAILEEPNIGVVVVEFDQNVHVAFGFFLATGVRPEEPRFQHGLGGEVVADGLYHCFAHIPDKVRFTVQRYTIFLICEEKVVFLQAE